jgi:hypothetical protein
MVCGLLFGVGLLFAIGGFGGTVAVRHPAITLAGGAGTVMVILSTIIPAC